MDFNLLYALGMFSPVMIILCAWVIAMILPLKQEDRNTKSQKSNGTDKP
jgi:hypothetical protein